MRVYIAGVSSERQYVKALKSFHELQIRETDEVETISGAPGVFARVMLLNHFMEKKQFDAIFMVDLDMLFPEDTLERLRAHDLDMVCGHYYKRQFSPLQSICDVSPNGTWPYVPMWNPPREGMHKIISTGFGCVLIKRRVVEAVQAHLGGKANPFDIGDIKEITGDNYSFGQDKRFFTYANILNYQLWLDASLDIAHGCTVWLSHKLHNMLGEQNFEEYRHHLLQATTELHGMDEKGYQLRIEQLREIESKQQSEHTKIQQALSEKTKKIVAIQAQIAENEMQLEAEMRNQKSRRVTGPDGQEMVRIGNIPTIEKTREMREQREEVYRQEAIDLAEIIHEDIQSSGGDEAHLDGGGELRESGPAEEESDGV